MEYKIIEGNEKLDPIVISPGKDSIDITLEPKAGETINASEIDKCLQYTVENPRRIDAGQYD